MSKFLSNLGGPPIFIPPEHRVNMMYGPGAYNEKNAAQREEIQLLSTELQVDPVSLWNTVQNWQILCSNEGEKLRWREVAWEYNQAAKACLGEQWPKEFTKLVYKGDRSVSASWLRQKKIVEKHGMVLERRIYYKTADQREYEEWLDRETDQQEYEEWLDRKTKNAGTITDDILPITLLPGQTQFQSMGGFAVLGTKI